MSKRALSPTQFFHGSTAELQVGDVIKPGKDVGQNNYPQLQGWRSQTTWATNNEADAWDWGHMSHRSKRNTVYEVKPSETPTKRRALGGGPGRGAEFSMGHATVTRRIDIPPPNSDLMQRQNRQERAGQGVLPTMGSHVGHAPIGGKEYMHNMDRTWSQVAADDKEHAHDQARQKREADYKHPKLFP